MLEINKWDTFCKKLLEIKNDRILYLVLIHDVHIIKLCSFLDNAKEAYGTVVYLHCLNSSGKVKASLLGNEFQISPIKEVTTPCVWNYVVLYF